MKLRRVADISEQELLNCARSYLPTAFPNPNRDGCPPGASLRALALNPRTTDPSIEEHISFCSPCVARYLEILSGQQSIAPATRRTWSVRVTLAFAAIFVATLCVFISAKHRAKPIVTKRTSAPPTLDGKPGQTETATYLPIFIDLSNAGPTRGPKQAAGSAEPIIPCTSRLDLTLRLPLGSPEQPYSITLRSKRAVVWTESAQARRQNGDTLLHVRADFSHVPVGNYQLQVASGERRLTMPVLIKDILLKNTEPKP